MNEFRFADLSVGQNACFSATVSREMLAEFSRLTGDNNPLHTDAAYASSRGHRGVVVHGALVASLFSTLVGMYLPGKYALLHGFKVSFRAPVFVGDVLEVRGDVSHCSPSYRQIEMIGTITNQFAKKVVRAVLQVGLYE